MPAEEVQAVLLAPAGSSAAISLDEARSFTDADGQANLTVWLTSSEPVSYGMLVIGSEETVRCSRRSMQRGVVCMAWSANTEQNSSFEVSNQRRKFGSTWESLTTLTLTRAPSLAHARVRPSLYSL